MRQLLLSGEGHRQILTTCNRVGITPGMLKMAMQLSRDEPLPMRELARRFSCDASYVTSIVDGLEQVEVAERRPHPSDRRVKTVVLTEHGAELLARVNVDLDVPPAAFDVLDRHEQEQLRDLLGRVVAAATSSGDLPSGAGPTGVQAGVAPLAPAGGPSRAADESVRAG
jgi:DNA-binding MarR family transcriptional regulator